MRLHPIRYEGVSLARSARSLIDRPMLALPMDSIRPSSLGCLVKALTCSSRMLHSSRLRAAAVKGTLPCSQRSAPLMARSIRGITHGGVRWKRVSRPASGWIAGTIWIAEAPVPIIATRLPRRSAPWSHCAEWKTSPENESSPGMSGIFGSESGPVAETTTSAVSVPRVVSISQRSSPESQRIIRTSWSRRMCGRSPKVSATFSR